jgi:hypothetical protein
MALFILFPAAAPANIVPARLLSGRFLLVVPQQIQYAIKQSHLSSRQRCERAYYQNNAQFSTRNLAQVLQRLKKKREDNLLSFCRQENL